jgi:hypothetical protein
MQNKDTKIMRRMAQESEGVELDVVPVQTPGLPRISLRF